MTVKTRKFTSRQNAHEQKMGFKTIKHFYLTAYVNNIVEVYQIYETKNVFMIHYTYYITNFRQQDISQ